VTESRDNGNIVLSVEDLRRQGEDWLESLAPRTRVYVTLDMDVLDPPLVPAVNAPEPDGLQFGELCGLIRQVADRHEIVGIDVVEVNPMLDLPNQLTSFLAVQLVVFTIGQALRSQQRAGRTEP
jgi:agmatinase